MSINADAIWNVKESTSDARISQDWATVQTPHGGVEENNSSWMGTMFLVFSTCHQLNLYDTHKNPAGIMSNH